MRAYVDLYEGPPSEWGKILRALGVTWESSEPIPMAERVGLIGVKIPAGAEIPKWLKICP